MYQTQYTVFTLTDDNDLISYECTGTPKSIAKEFSSDKFVYMRSDELATLLPADFSAETYTVTNGKLVPANTEVLDARETIKAKAAAEVEIAELKQYLADTDYCVIKAAEVSAPMAELYPEQHTRRAEARARINELEILTK